MFDEFGSAAAQNAYLGPGLVILRQLADGIKQFGTALIVKKLGRDRLGRCRQAKQDLSPEVLSTGVGVVEPDRGGTHKSPIKRVRLD